MCHLYGFCSSVDVVQVTFSTVCVGENRERQVRSFHNGAFYCPAHQTQISHSWLWLSSLLKPSGVCGFLRLGSVCQCVLSFGGLWGKRCDCCPESRLSESQWAEARQLGDIGEWADSPSHTSAPVTLCLLVTNTHLCTVCVYALMNPCFAHSAERFGP